MMKAESNLHVDLCGLEVDIAAPGFVRRASTSQAILADDLKIIVEGLLASGQAARIQASPKTGHEIYHSEDPIHLAAAKAAQLGLQMEVHHVILLLPDQGRDVN